MEDGWSIKDIVNKSRKCEDWENLETDNLPHNWSSMWLRLAVVAAANLRLAIVVE